MYLTVSIGFSRVSRVSKVRFRVRVSVGISVRFSFYRATQFASTVLGVVILPSVHPSVCHTRAL